MMQRFVKVTAPLLQLLFRLLLVSVLFAATRLLFYQHNQELLPAISAGEYLYYQLAGLRFDWSAITYINLLFIVASLLPFSFRYKKGYRRTLLFVFLFFNGIAIFLELADIAWFGFAYRRSISSDFQMLSKSANLLPTYLLEYWYLIALWPIFLYLLYLGFKKSKNFISELQSPVYQWLVFAFSMGFFILSLRGGWQLRPLMPITANEYTNDTRLCPLITNSSIGLIFSLQQKQLEYKNYYSETELKDRFELEYKPSKRPPLTTPKNVMLIVLESFGEAQVGYFHPDSNQISNTPFLDSLMQLSYHAEQSFANGLRSTQGIVAIAAGLPALMEDPLMFSAYQSNRIDGLGSLLKDQGYTSGFFHGSNPGSMEFGRFAKLAGFDYFYDKTSFPDPQFDDGNWGIWDVPYFQFTLKVLDTMPKPFAALLFSLSSHHPYKVEQWFENLYPDLNPVARSYRYTDEALRQFFKTASSKEWFNETLFVITADHTGPPTFLSNNRISRYRVPILFYDPAQQIKDAQDGVMQQIDILPSVLDYIGYPNIFHSFGRSKFDQQISKRYAYMYADGLYQIVDDEYVLFFDGQASRALYSYLNDPQLKQDLKSEKPKEVERLEGQLKAVLQVYHRAMIRNGLGRSQVSDVRGQRLDF